MAVQYRNIPFKRNSVLKLDKFMGVDFRTADTQVNLNRSPYSINMIAGSNFYYPKKRNGYKKVIDDLFLGKANGLYSYTKNGVTYLIIHFGNKIYSLDIKTNEVKEIFNGINDDKSVSFVMNSVIYILDGENYYCYDGVVFCKVLDNAFIPTTTITKSPSGGGNTFEEVNLISPKRKNSFAADGTSMDYFLDAQNIDMALVTAVVNNVEKVETTDFVVNRELGKVTFNAVPPKFTGADNVVITFSKSVVDNADKINKCTICGIFGGANNSRVFFSGNPKYPNIDYSSGLFDPTYFPDRGYTKVGSDESPIVGYVKQYNAMLIVKKSNSSDASIYLRTFELDGNGKALFPVSQGISGVPCICGKSINILEDVPLFLSNSGIYAVAGSSVYMEKSTENRSAFINSRLLAEENLTDAVSAVFEGKYYLSINNHCYVADSRQKYYDKISDNMQYEWYYWDNILADEFCVLESNLYFIGNGHLYRFYRNDEPNIYHDDDIAIKAVWRTPLMDFSSNLYKNIKRIIVTLQPFTRSSCKLFCMSDKNEFTFYDNTYLDILNFNEIDFTRFTFNTFSSPKIWEEKCTDNNIKFYAIELINDNNYEGFGFYSIDLEFQII